MQTIRFLNFHNPLKTIGSVLLLKATLRICLSKCFREQTRPTRDLRTDTSKNKRLHISIMACHPCWTSPSEMCPIHLHFGACTIYNFMLICVCFCACVRVYVCVYMSHSLLSQPESIENIRQEFYQSFQYEFHSTHSVVLQ